MKYFKVSLRFIRFDPMAPIFGNQNSTYKVNYQRVNYLKWKMKYFKVCLRFIRFDPMAPNFGNQRKY